MLNLSLGLALGAGSYGSSGPVYDYSRTITVDNTTGTAKTDYPVSIALTSGNFNFTHVRSAGEDIAFKVGGTTLSHWIEAWDSGAQTGTIWVKVPSIPDAASTTVTMQYGNATVPATGDIHGTFLFAEDFNDLDRVIGVPDKTYATRGNTYGVRLGNRVANIVTASGTVGAWDESVREQANIIYDAADADPNRRYKFYYTGQVLPANTGTRRIGLSCSPDGVTWTPYVGNPIIAQGEDPYIVRNIDGTPYRDGSNQLHMFTEDQAQLDMLHYTSTDGLAWTADPANPVMVRGGTYDANLVASPCVVHVSGDNKFVMLYEGRAAADTTCLARATTLMGASWTKEATNPIFAGDVIDEVVWTGTEWIMLYHGTGTNMARAKTAVTDPWLWDSASFADYGPNPIWGQNGQSYNGVPEGTAQFGRKITTQPAGTAAFDIFDVMGSAHWAFEILGTAAKSPYTSVIAAGNGSLILDPTLDNTANACSMLVYTRTVSLTSDFQIMTRRKVAVTTDDQRAQISFGAGTPTVLGGNETLNYWPDGYHLLNVNPGAGSDVQWRKYVAGAVTVLATGTITAAEGQNFNRHETTYLANGTLRYSINGTTKLSTSDSAHVALAKNIMLSQGASAGNPGGKQTVDWTVARKYDGQDPATTVGAEV